jgi:hypothetical protein
MMRLAEKRKYKDADGLPSYQWFIGKTISEQCGISFIKNEVGIVVRLF